MEGAVAFGDQLWRVTAPHFCAGFTVTYDGIVSSAAPIIKYALNKRALWFKNYCRKRDGKWS